MGHTLKQPLTHTFDLALVPHESTCHRLSALAFTVKKQALDVAAHRSSPFDAPESDKQLIDKVGQVIIKLLEFRSTHASADHQYRSTSIAHPTK
jgi:hypothetical protein